MAAQTMTTAVTLFAGPGNMKCGRPYVNDSISFRLVLDGTIRTLSNNNPPAEESFRGLLFAPSLDPSDPCDALTAPLVPTNVTRKSDLPDYIHDIIGLAPWVSQNCTQSYLTASRRASAQAVIFYQPESQDTGKPPAATSSIWSLGDGGQWKKDNAYPVYAIPGPSGSKLMHELAQYSGDSAEDQPSPTPDPLGTLESVNCARLYALLDLEPSNSTSVPGVWVFILAILGVLLVVVIIAYFAVQYIQKRRRETLRRRIAAGEIDLEYLGIKRLVVPPEVLAQLPLYTYPDLSTAKPPPQADKTPNATVVESNPRPTPPATRSDVDVKAVSTTNSVHGEQDEGISAIMEEMMPNLNLPPRGRDGCRLTFSQFTCAICLEDFLPGSSYVRELPCTHIFHPECIDPFLMRDSSACPVCKSSVLPPSFISNQVTNFMVRREQRIRRLHQHQDRELQGLQFGFLERMQFRTRSLFTAQRPSNFTENHRNTSGSSQAEQDQADDVQDPARRAMMQQRAMALLGTPVSVIDGGQDRTQPVSAPPPKWRTFVGNFIPGF